MNLTVTLFFVIIKAVLIGFIFSILVERHRRRKSRAVRIVLTVNGKEITEMQQFKDSEQVTFGLAGKDAKGAVIAAPTLDSPPVWSSTDEAVIKAVPSADGLSCAAVGQLPGVAKLQFSGVSGGKSFVASEDITVVPGDAVEIDLVAGAAQPQ